MHEKFAVFSPFFWFFVNGRVIGHQNRLLIKHTPNWSESYVYLWWMLSLYVIGILLASISYQKKKKKVFFLLLFQFIWWLIAIQAMICVTLIPFEIGRRTLECAITISDPCLATDNKKFIFVNQYLSNYKVKHFCRWTYICNIFLMVYGSSVFSHSNLH